LCEESKPVSCLSLDVQWHLILGRQDEHWQDVSVSGVAAVPVLPENKKPSVRVRYFIQLYTDKKENQIFLIYKEIQSGAVAKSYMRKGFLIYEEMPKYFPIYKEAVYHI
jgi:hypothetical protein